MVKIQLNESRIYPLSWEKIVFCNYSTGDIYTEDELDQVITKYSNMTVIED